MTAYYNENSPFAASWLRLLIADKLIAPGDVDERSIKDVIGSDLKGYDQCHFFAGIGGWSLSLRMAGWPDNRAVFTGSCPCQPFSIAGKKQGVKDERHLWPEFKRLIAERKPSIVFGEQVAAKDGRIWLAGVRSDLEVLGYAVGAADLCAAGVGAPHIRQRLYWVANTKCDTGNSRRTSGQSAKGNGEASTGARAQLGRLRGIGRVAHSAGTRHFTEGQGAEAQTRDETRLRGLEPGCLVGVPHADKPGLQGRFIQNRPSAHQQSSWEASRVISCLDGKNRRVPLEPALFPLAHGVLNLMGTLRGAGNAIVPSLAAEFIKAYMEVC